jgi:hypothetical protein
MPLKHSLKHREANGLTKIVVVQPSELNKMNDHLGVRVISARSSSRNKRKTHQDQFLTEEDFDAKNQRMPPQILKSTFQSEIEIDLHGQII